MKVITTVHVLRPLILCALLLLSGCGGLTGRQADGSDAVEENRDYSCSYFYFLWGTHAEYEKRFSEALDAYEKALVCDPSADYIKRKLPLLFIRTGDTDRAVKLIETALQDQPEDTARRALLASILMQQRDNEGARKQYEAILDYDPDNEQILFRLGALLSQTGDYDRARSYLNQVLELDANAYYAHLYLARIAEQLDEFDTARYHYLTALSLNWSADLSYEIAEFYAREKRYDDSINLLRKTLEKDQTDEQARLGIVQALLAQDREEEAIAELSLAREYSNRPEHLSLVLARLYLKNGEDQKAIDNLLAILDAADNAEARYMLGVIYSDQGRFEDAVSMLDGISPGQESFEDAVILKSRILHQNGQTDTALDMLETYLADEETRRPLFYILAASLYEEEQASERSRTVLEQGARLYPEDERLLFEYGVQLERVGRLQDAIDVMLRVIDIDNDHAEALNFVGYTWADNDENLEQALAYITKAVQLKPNNGYIQDSLGWVYFRLGKFDQARNALLSALELLPEDPNIHDHLGDVYLAQGQFDKARAAYRTALEKYDDQKKKDGVQKKINELDEHR